MTGPVLVCALEADGATWHHCLTIEQVEAWEAPAIVVAECPEHEPLRVPGGLVDFTWPEGTAQAAAERDR